MNAPVSGNGAGMSKAAFFTLLRVIEASDENAVRMVERGAIARIKLAMETHASDVEVQREACRVLSDLLANGEEREHSLVAQMIHQDFIRQVKISMEGHADDAQVQQFACEVLFWIARGNPENRLGSVVCMVEQGIIGMIECAMELHAQSDDLIRNAFMTLNEIIMGDRGILLPMVERGLITRIKAAMERHTHDTHLLEEACRFLAHIANGSPYCATKMIEVGVIPQVIVAIDACANSAEPLSRFFTLACIVENCFDHMLLTGRGIPRSAKLVVEQGVIGECMRVLDTHRNDAKAVQAAMRILAKVLAGVRASSRLVLKQGQTQLELIRKARRAMQDYISDAVLQDLACWLLTELASSIPASSVLMVQEGMLEQIRVVMDVHSNVAQVQSNAFAALEKIIKGNPKSTRLIPVRGAIRRIKLTMSTHMQDPQLLSSAINLLASVEDVPQVHTQMLRQGVVEQINIALIQHPNLQADIQAGTDAIIADKVEQAAGRPASHVENTRRAQQLAAEERTRCFEYSLQAFREGALSAAAGRTQGKQKRKKGKQRGGWTQPRGHGHVSSASGSEQHLLADEVVHATRVIEEAACRDSLYRTLKSAKEVLVRFKSQECSHGGVMAAVNTMREVMADGALRLCELLREAPKREVCSVCLDNAATHMPLCGHKCLCQQCGEALVSKLCPICRRPFRSLVRVYDS